MLIFSQINMGKKEAFLMDIMNFKAEVQAIDWRGLEDVPTKLIELALATQESKDCIHQIEGVNVDFLSNANVTNGVMSAIGNDHSGVYYAVARDALPFIIQVALFGNHMVARNCAINLLIDLFYFYPNNPSDEDLRIFVRKTIKNTIVENMDNFNSFASKDTRNNSLICSLFEIADEMSNC